MKTYNGTGQVKPTLERMKSIPAGENPFWHDAISMGAELSNGWLIMFSGNDRKDDPRALEQFYIVNQRSGQRIRIRLTPDDQSPTWNRIKRAYWDLRWKFGSWKHARKWRRIHARNDAQRAAKQNGGSKCAL